MWSFISVVAVRLSPGEWEWFHVATQISSYMYVWGAVYPSFPLSHLTLRCGSGYHI